MSKRKFRLKGLNIDEVSGVDRGANQHSRVAIIKRDSQASQSGEQERDMADISKVDREPLVGVCKMLFDEDATTDFRTALSQEMRNQRMMDVHDKMFPLMDALRESVMTSAAELSGEDRDEKIRSNVESFLASVRRKLDGDSMEKAMAVMKGTHSGMTEEEKGRMKELMDKEGMSEEEAADKAMREMRKNSPDEGAGSPGKSQTSKQEGDMDPKELATKLGDLENQVAELTKQAQEHGLEVQKREDGTVALAKASEEYVTLGGEQVAKSQVPAGVLKALETQEAQLEDMRKRQEAEDLRKRADSELPNLKGSADVRGRMLKAIDAEFSDSPELHKEACETLKAADGFAQAAFAEVGKTVADDENSATAQLEQKVNKYAEQNGVSYHQAFDAVTKSGEGKQLMQKSRAEQRGQAN